MSTFFWVFGVHEKFLKIDIFVVKVDISRYRAPNRKTNVKFVFSGLENT